MARFQRIKTHVAQAEATLTSRYREKPNTLAMLRAFVRRVQELEEAIWDVIEGRLLVASVGQKVPWDNGAGADTLVDAQGAQLDMLGALVGEARIGRADSVYATAIRLRLRIARSSGTPNDLIEIAKLSYPGAEVVYIDSIPAETGFLPAQARISIAPTDGSVAAQLRRAKPAGVALEVLEGVNPTKSFRWGSSSGGVTAGRHTWGNAPSGVDADSRWGTGSST